MAALAALWCLAAPAPSHALDFPTGVVKISVETDSARPLSAPRGMYPPSASLPRDVHLGFYAEPARGKENYVRIPVKYTYPERSGLTFTVQAGAQEYDIPLY